MEVPEGYGLLNDINEEWIAHGGLSSTLFATSKTVSSTEQTISGYLEDLLNSKKSELPDIVKRIKVANKKNHNAVNLLENLRLLCDLKIEANKNVHIEDLLNQISSLFSNLVFLSHKTYKNSLVNVDPKVFTNALSVLLVSGTNSSTMKTRFSKRDRLGVLEIYSTRSVWLSNKLIFAIVSLNRNQVVNKKLDLTGIVCNYALEVLKTTEVSVWQRSTHKKQILYIGIPLTRQLNVFE